MPTTILIALFVRPKPLGMRMSFSGVAMAVMAANGTPGMLYRKVSNFANSVQNSFPLMKEHETISFFKQFGDNWSVGSCKSPVRCLSEMHEHGDVQHHKRFTNPRLNELHQLPQRLSVSPFSHHLVSITSKSCYSFP